MRKSRRFAVAAAAAIAMIVPTAGAAMADPIQLCYVELVVDKSPAVWAGPGGAGVETGEYHVEQNCVYIDPATVTAR